MPDFDRHNLLLGQTSQGTRVRSAALGSSNSQGITPSNNHGGININLSLESGTNFPNQNQATPMPSQIRFHQNGTEIGMIRSNPCFPGSMNTDNTSHSHFIQPQNTINININMANNCPININLLSNNSSSPSTTSYTQFSSPGVITMKENFFYDSVLSHHREIAADGSCLRQNAVNLSAFRRQSSLLGSQRVHGHNDIIPQSASNLRLLGLSPRYFPRDNLNDFSTYSSSTMNATGEQSVNLRRRNNNSIENIVIPHQNLQAAYNLHERENSDIQALPQEPSQNGIETDPRSSAAQANTGPNVQPHLQTQRNRHSTRACKSHPYIKYGPYTCPECHVTFQNANKYAAHVQTHYKNESLSERKQRREGKFRRKDLHIAQSAAGITVMPGFLPAEDTLPVTSNTIRGSSSGPNEGEGFSQVQIKKEIETDEMN